jgi:hypothetical protein
MPVYHDCLHCCGVSTPCCPGSPLPRVLYVTLSGASASCACLEGLTFALAWTGFASIGWEYRNLAHPCDALIIGFRCPPASTACHHVSLGIQLGSGAFRNNWAKAANVGCTCDPPSFVFTDMVVTYPTGNPACGIVGFPNSIDAVVTA